MRKFDADFRTALRQTVEDIEADSGVELVATIMPRADRYCSTYLLTGLLCSFTLLTFMMFVQTEFWYVLIYLETIGTLVFSMGLLWAFPVLVRFLVGKKKMKERAETKARALFQRAGMVETQERIGILITFAWFEKCVTVLPDTGATELIPPDELETIQRQLESVFKESDVAEAILRQLAALKPTFKVYIPRSIHDINELPDELWLH